MTMREDDTKRPTHTSEEPRSGAYLRPAKGTVSWAHEHAATIEKWKRQWESLR